jgi:predicted component of type VI protein secretion system
MLLCKSSRLWRSVFEESVEVAGEVALEAAGRFAVALAFSDATLDVGDRRRVRATSGDEDHVQCAVESAIAAAVEPVADRLAGGGGDRGAAGEPRERGFACDPAAVRPGDQDLRGGERTDTGLVEQLRRQLAGERLDLACELALFSGQLSDAARDRAQRLQRPAQLDVAVPVRSHRRQPTQELRTCQRSKMQSRDERCADCLRGAQTSWRSAVSDKVARAVGGAMSPLALPPRRALMVEVLVSSSV